MTSNIIKKQYIAMQPEGVIGNIKTDSDEDLMYDGLSKDFMTVYEWLVNIASLRDPYKTPILEDLEWEYGIKANSILSVDERRRNLAAIVYAKKSNGDIDGLGEALVKQGFISAKVFDNNPVTDTTAITVTNGEYVVNGQIFKQVVGYKYRCIPTAPEFTQQICCSTFKNQSAGSVKDVKTEYTYVPQGDFSKIFFVGASVVRDGVSDEITQINPVTVPIHLRGAFLETILRYKPLDTWALISVNWVEVEDVIKSTFGAPEVIKDTMGATEVIKDTVS